MGATAASTASTVALLVVQLALVRARHATPDTAVPVARLQTPVPPPQPRARTGVTALFTASTVALSATPLARARAPHATSDTVVPVARLQTPVLPPQPRAMTGVTETFTASTVALSATPLARARARHATPDTVVPVARPPLPLPRLPQRTMQKLRYHHQSRHHRHQQDRLLAFHMFALIRRHRLATHAHLCLRLCF